MSQLPAKVGRGAAVWMAAQTLASEIMKLRLNRDEAYVDRIKREFNLGGYGQARAIYDSNPAYWERLYGSDPLNSRNHPAAPPSSLLPREGGRDSGVNYLDPARMDTNTAGPFGTGGQFVPGPAVPPRPLYETRSFGTSSDGAASGATDNGQPVRRLVRVPVEGLTPFDAGAPSVAPVPFVDGTARTQQALDNSLPARGAASWDLSDRFGNWDGVGGVFGPAR